MNTNNPPDGPGFLNAVLNKLTDNRPQFTVLWRHQKLPSAGVVRDGDANLTYGRTRRDDE